MANRPSPFDSALRFALGEVERLGDPRKLPPPLRTLVVVHAAQGVIDNGGLRYFFESDFPGRPAYALFVDAYRAIGAHAEADALADAVSLFPFPNPHRSKKRRNEFLDRFDDDDHGDDDDVNRGRRPDDPLKPLTRKLCGNKTVWRRLEDYVRRHAEAFRR